MDTGYIELLNTPVTCCVCCSHAVSF